jgi:hypothetical protein
MMPHTPTHSFTLEDDNGTALAEYLHYAQEDLLHVRWHGHLTGNEIIRGAQRGSELSHHLHYSLILNDKCDTGGDWSDALPWLQYEWLPQALAAGVRAMAYVFSPDRENRFASHHFVAALRPHIAIEVFEDLETALAWLLKQNAAPTPA